MVFYYLDKLEKEHNWWGMFVRDCKQFLQLKPLSKYVDGFGIVMIEKRDWENEENKVYSLIEQCSKHKKLLFMLCDSSEGYPTTYLYYPFFEYLEKCGIDKKRRILMYNNSIHANKIHEFQNFYTFYYPSFLYEISSKKENNFNEILPSYDFSCFNRKSKTHKLETVQKIIQRNLNCATTFDYFNDTEFNHPSFLDIQKDHDGNGESSYLKSKHYFLGKINICTESEYYSTFHEKSTADCDWQWDDMIHLTEKVFRNISWGIPYVLISSKGSLNEIRRLGFKTFDSIIDESYDNADDSNRIDLALDAANELLKKHNSEEMNEILKYNKRLILEYNNNLQFFNEQIIYPLKNHINNLVI